MENKEKRVMIVIVVFALGIFAGAIILVLGYMLLLREQPTPNPYPTRGKEIFENRLNEKLKVDEMNMEGNEEESEDIDSTNVSEEVETWTGEITLSPKNMSGLKKEIIKPNDVCPDIQEGIVKYYNSNYDTNMIINNSNLDMTVEQEVSFNDALSIIKGDKELKESEAQMGLHPAFETSCLGAGHQLISEVSDVIYPKTDSARAYVSFGGMQAYPTDLKTTNMTVFVYAKKGDNIIALEKIFTADEIFEKDDGTECMVKEDYSGQDVIDLDCLEKKYLSMRSQAGKIEGVIEELVGTFAL